MIIPNQDRAIMGDNRRQRGHKKQPGWRIGGVDYTEVEWKNKSYQMSQKFITSAEKTAKKALILEEQKPKKFVRKRSERDRSFDSKRSKEGSISSHYIKPSPQTTNIKINLANDKSFLYFDEVSTSTILGQETDRPPRKTMFSRNSLSKEPTRQQCTLTLKIKILETQMKAKEGECERFKLQAEEQRQRRRKAEYDRKVALKEAGAFEKQNEDLIMQVKKLTKEKEILNKQIEFLQKINYDQKTRNIQSFREKHMQEELFKLKQKLHSQKSTLEVDYEKQLEHISSNKQAAEEKVRSMESLVDVQKRTIANLKEELFEEKMLTKQKIIRSEQYRELRERFKKFIDQYKEMRCQNSSLKTLLEGKETQLVLSESERENN